MKLSLSSISVYLFVCFYIEYRVVAFRSLPTICYMSVPAWILRKCDMRTVNGGRKNFSLIYLANAYTQPAVCWMWMRVSERSDANVLLSLSCSSTLCAGYVYSAAVVSTCMSMCWNNKKKRVSKYTHPQTHPIQLTHKMSVVNFRLGLCIHLRTHTERVSERQPYSLSHSLRLLYISLSLSLSRSLCLTLCVC